ncbi:protein FAM228A isoform X1 [Rattus norvegicus]|uniref:Protein FAM228A n=2 Tax=Rattus norvegicus TaxID=10116 RepID=F228A_RAT|nr:protein FAM228A [Rattus norvegicus]XP_006239920.1 protein FAM228A isoform X1 [Rattus norvegicus]Q5XIN5.2 RecName: Full=Protein FAM228A [Rattus norvegicus]|eukprot:XP_006239920.1 PREDICTED: protein FAM228A isoform X1 [Rattus norvegicus]
MADTKSSNCNEHFSVEKLKEWPEPESVSLMKELAREDIDEAVHAILFRENYIVKKLDTYLQHEAVFKERRKEMLHKKWVENVAQPLQQRIIEKLFSYRRPGKSQVKYEYCLKHTNEPTKPSPLCECLFQKQQALREAKGPSYHRGRGKQPGIQKEAKETEKGLLFTRSPQFPLRSHCTVPRDRQRLHARFVQNKPCGRNKYKGAGSEKVSYALKPHLPKEEKKTVNRSQLGFERQFHASKLSQQNKGAEKKGLALGTRAQRPRSWAAADSPQGTPLVGRRVMTAEILGKHLASLQQASRAVYSNSP